MPAFPFNTLLLCNCYYERLSVNYITAFTNKVTNFVEENKYLKNWLMKTEKRPRLSGSPLIPLLMFTILIMSGCELIGGIFQTGVGVGAFIVIIVVIIIFAISRRFRR